LRKAPSPRAGAFLVFFDWGKSAVTRDSAAALDTVAATFRQTGGGRIMLSGHSDRSGPPAANRRSAHRRVEAVRSYLARHGVPEAAIVTSAFGEEVPIVSTEDGVREAQNRRVEIRLVLGSGN
jgi:OOP family OmpA-OmpF porin